MIFPSSLRRCLAILSMSVLSLTAAPPEPITDADKQALQADSISVAAPAAVITAEAKAKLESELAESAKVSQAATTFLAQADLPAIPPPAIAPATRPLDVKPGPETAVINSEGGMYFDPVERVAVYFKNVTVRHPDYNLSGANELKIYFEKKPTKSEPDKSGSQGDFKAQVGKMQRIIATGAVLLEQTRSDSGKELIKASGATLSYDLQADKITISGGFPWVLQGANYMRAKEANLVLRISPKAGSYRGEGHWEMGGDLPKN